MYKQILEGKVVYPSKLVSRNAKDFISKLLVTASVRLGALKNGALDISR